QARRGMRRPGGARLPVPSSSVMGPAGTGVHPAFLGDGCGGVVVVFGGGRDRGLGGNLEPGGGGGVGGGGRAGGGGVVGGGGGGPGSPPSAFPDWSPLLSVYSCSRAVVF